MEFVLPFISRGVIFPLCCCGSYTCGSIGHKSLACSCSSLRPAKHTMSRLAGVTFEVAGGTVAKRWFPALVSGSANTAGGQVVLGKAPNTLVRLAAQQWSREPGPSYPLMGFATSNMSRTKKDLNRFGGALTSGAVPAARNFRTTPHPPPFLCRGRAAAGTGTGAESASAFHCGTAEHGRRCS